MTLASLANGAWSAINLVQLSAFERGLDRPRAAQERLLEGYLRRNAATVLGARLGLAGIASVADFQRKVPLSTYDDYVPLIERVCAGEPRVLTTDPVLRLLPSSGSTAAAKLIPQTASYQREIDRAVGAWVADLYRSVPGLRGGPAYWAISPALDPPSRASVVPIGFEDDAAWLGRWLQPLVRAVMAVPSDVQRIRELSAFRFATLRHLLAAEQLRLISIWHPTFLQLLLDALPESWPRLLASLAAGSTRERARARVLERLAPDQPERIWPQLRLVSAWADAHAASAYAQLSARLPAVQLQAKGLFATEGCVSIPFRGARPVAYRSHFFEFLDESGRARLLDELAVGGEYEVVVSTGGGLLRYRLHDRVRVEGMLGRTPSLAFVGKTDLVSDLRGEKLSDGFVGAALNALLAPRPLEVRFAMLAPETIAAGQTRYVLFLEAGGNADAELARALDAALCENPHYALCRRLGQLAAPRVSEIAPGGHRAYIERVVRAGRRLGEIKPVALSPLDGWESHFSERTQPASRDERARA